MPATGRLVTVFILYVLTGGVVLADGDDDSLFPSALAVLSTDRFLYPAEMGDWPARIDSKHQLFIDDCLVQSTSGLTREYHKLRRHPANPVRGNVYEGKITWAGRDALERPPGTSPRLACIDAPYQNEGRQLRLIDISGIIGS